VQVIRSTTIDVILTTAEVIGALKAHFPHDLSIQALPLNSSVKGVVLKAEVRGACGLEITYTKDTTVPAPAPIINDPDPA
jgi:hypothetical protein